MSDDILYLLRTAGKVIIAKDRRIAFWMPNYVTAIARRTEDFIVSIADLEARLVAYGQAEEFPSEWDKDEVPELWEIQKGCNRG